MADTLLNLENTKRDAKMDVLRIVAMFFIVIDHLATVSLGMLEDVEFFVDAAKIPWHMVSSLIVCFAVVGVNLFFLLSGYFKINFKPGKAVSIVIKLYVYWILGTLIAMACGFKHFSSALEVVEFMVIGISKYWFILIYLLLMICAPLLNSLADKLFDGVGKCGYFVFVTLLFFTVIGFIADYFYPIMGTNGGYSVIWAGTVYMYGRLIRKKEDKFKKSALKYFLIYVLLCLANYAIVAPLIATGVGNSNGKIAYLFLNYNDPLIFFASLSFFMMFVSFKPLKSEKRGRAVSFVATHTLAVYLWHSNNPFLKNTRAFLMMAVEPFWAKVLLLIPNALLLFAFGVAVDIVYEFLLSKPISKLCAYIERMFAGVASKICAVCSRVVYAHDNASNEQYNDTVINGAPSVGQKDDVSDNISSEGDDAIADDRYSEERKQETYENAGSKVHEQDASENADS